MYIKARGSLGMNIDYPPIVVYHNGSNYSTSVEPRPSAEVRPVRSELDDIAVLDYSLQMIHIDGIPSMHLGYKDVFGYEHCDIPDLDGKRVWCFKVIREGSALPLIELRETDDLSDVVTLSYSWGEQLPKEPLQLGVYNNTDRTLCLMMLGSEWSLPHLTTVLADLSENNWLWMDQIAKQPGLSPTEVIATFPAVYTRCSVVALLPGL